MLNPMLASSNTAGERSEWFLPLWAFDSNCGNKQLVDEERK